MGGEQNRPNRPTNEENGSSPHGRGTENQSHGEILSIRFIPAWAGNSQQQRKNRQIGTVHPRMGGEQKN